MSNKNNYVLLNYDELNEKGAGKTRQRNQQRWLQDSEGDPRK